MCDDDMELTWLWMRCCRLLQGATGTLVVERKRERRCDITEREREGSLPLELA
jgi:hypothetical protein